MTFHKIDKNLTDLGQKGVGGEVRPTRDRSSDKYKVLFKFPEPFLFYFIFIMWKKSLTTDFFSVQNNWSGLRATIGAYRITKTAEV